MTSYSLDPGRRGGRVWAEIDLEALRHNVGLLKSIVGPTVEIVAVAKANAYGHGARAVVRAVLSAGASEVGVGDSSEALELIDAGLRVPILILGAVVPGEYRRVVDHGIQVAVHGFEGVRELAAAAAAAGRECRVHVLVDTGMGRLGVDPDGALDLVDEVRRSSWLRLTGLATHFSTPSDVRVTEGQIERFETIRLAVIDRGEPPVVHAAASAAILAHPRARYNAVRPGLLIYGLDPGGVDPARLGFRPVLSLRTRIVHLKELPAGAPIGYEQTYRTPAPTRIATLPIGYHDGFPMTLSEGGEALVRGRRAPIVGRITMDYTTIDVGGIDGVQVGDVATLIGPDGVDEIRTEEVAERAGTIPYAIVCGLGDRVERIYRPDPIELPVSTTALESSRPGYTGRS